MDVSTRNRHSIDGIAEVRAEIRQLQEREELRQAILADRDKRRGA